MRPFGNANANANAAKLPISTARRGVFLIVGAFLIGGTVVVGAGVSGDSKRETVAQTCYFSPVQCFFASTR